MRSWKTTETRLRKGLKKLSQPQTGWVDVFPAIMGKADGTVLTGIPGVVWVREVVTGQPLTVYNYTVENTPKIQVEVGKRVDQPGLWQVKGTLEPFSVPSSRGPALLDHHERHEFLGPDTVWVDRKQIRHLTVLVYDASNFIVKLFGGIVLTANGITKIATQTVDLSSYVPTEGAVFVSIESDDDGVISVNEGTGFGAPAVATVDDIPSPGSGQYTRAYVLLYEGQSALSNNDIVVPMPPDFNPLSPAGTHNHDDRYPRKWTGNTVAPTVNEDSDAGYAVDDIWVDETHDTAYIAVDVTVGAAVWLQMAASSGSGWFNVQDYGAVGDGTTDDTAAIDDAIDALNTAGRGVLYFPAGKYLCSSALTAITVAALILGDGMSSFDEAVYGSEVVCSSATAVLFTINSKIAKFQNIALRNTATTPSAGSGILATSAYIAQRVDFDTIGVYGFYLNIDVQVGASWTMRSCQLIAPVTYALKIRNTVNGDAGDWAISDSMFYSQVRDATAGIRIESSGGGKIVNCKVNMGTDSKRFTYGIDINGAGTTSIMLISNTSVENITTNPIRATGSWDYIIIHGCQLAHYTTNNTSAIVLNSMDYFVISNVVMVYSPPSTSSAAAIDLTNCTYGTIVGIQQRGFTTALAQTGCSNISYLDAAGASTYTDISANDPDTDVTGAELEELTDGSETTLHSHASVGSSTAAEILMEDGVTFPPVPLTNEDGTDWIYDY